MDFPGEEKENDRLEPPPRIVSAWPPLALGVTSSSERTVPLYLLQLRLRTHAAAQ